MENKFKKANDFYSVVFSGMAVAVVIGYIFGLILTVAVLIDYFF